MDTSPPDHETAASNGRILICVQDASVQKELIALVAKGGWESLPCDHMDAFQSHMSDEIVAGIISEDCLTEPAICGLRTILDNQPRWSDFPFIVLNRSDSERNGWQILQQLPNVGHATLLHEPVAPDVLHSVLRVAQRARQRQLEIRDHLAERERQNEALAESATLTRRLFEHNQDCLMVLDANGVVLDANAAAERLLSTTDAGEVTGQSWPRIWGPAHDMASQALATALQQEVASFDTEVRDAQGHSTWWDIWVAALRSDKSTTARFLAAARDITSHKEAEAAADKWKTRYEAAIRASGQMLYDWNPASNELTWTGNVEHFLSVPDSEAPRGFGRWIERIHPDDRDAFEEEVRRRTVQGERRTIQYRVRHSGQRYLDVEDRGNFIYDAHGAVMHLVGFVTDITDRKRVEKEVQSAIDLRERSLAKLEAVISSMHDGLIIMDAQGRFLSINPAALVLYEFATLEDARASQNTLAELYEVCTTDGEPLPPDQWAISRAKRGEQFRNLELAVRRKTSKRRWIANYSVTNVYDRTGERALSVITVRDVTAQKQAEQELRRLNESLEQRVAERTQSLLTYQSQLRALASDLSITEQRERRRIASELHDYLAQLLVACKMKRRLFDRHMNDDKGKALGADLDGMLDQALQYTRTLIADLSPSILYDAGLPAALKWLADRMHKQHDLNVRVHHDTEELDLAEDHAILIFQTVRELLFNVVKHAQTNDAVVTLALEPAGHLTVVVKDFGVGIEGKTDELAQSGSGKFGLFHIRERLEAMGGAFEITSEGGNGTEARLVAPLGDKRPKEEPESTWATVTEIPEDSESARRSRGVIRVVLVDDHEMVREGLRNIIESYPDVQVIGEAGDGEEAIDVVNRTLPDAVLMDLNMPRMGGVEATRRIKQRYQHITIIGLSVHEDEEMANSMRNAGASAYLIKGRPTDDLYHALRAVHR